MANKHRNEVELDVAGRRLKFKLTMSAIAAVESDTGLDFTDIAHVFYSERAPILIIRSIYLRGLEGSGMHYSEALATVDAFLDDTPLNDLAAPAAQIYNAVWGAVEDVAGKDEGTAAAATPESPGSS